MIAGEVVADELTEGGSLWLVTEEEMLITEPLAISLSVEEGVDC